MIEVKLNVEEYCHECCNFSSETTTISDFDGNKTVTVACEYSQHCKYLLKYLSEVKKNEHN